MRRSRPARPFSWANLPVVPIVRGARNLVPPTGDRLATSSLDTMTRIHSGLGGADYALFDAVQRAADRMAHSALALATMSRINRAADDPAGLIAAESLRAELASLEAADRTAERTGAIIDVADGALGQVGQLLNEIQGNVVAAASSTTSDAERAAYQAEIDGAVEAINRIGATTQFNGQRLLDGSLPAISLALSANVADQAQVDLPVVRADRLGGAAGSLADLATGGAASLASGQPGVSFDILKQARAQVLQSRAQLGAFSRYTLAAGRAVMAGAQENLSGALSRIADTDVASATAELVQSRILADVAIGALGISGQRRRMLLNLLADA